MGVLWFSWQQHWFLAPASSGKGPEGLDSSGWRRCSFHPDLGALLDLLQELGKTTAEYESLTELNFFAVQLRYDDELEVEPPNWLACFDLVENLLRQVEAPWPGA